MSLKRYAILAAVNQHYNSEKRQQQLNNNATAMSTTSSALLATLTTTRTAAIAATPSLSSPATSEEDASQEYASSQQSIDSDGDNDNDSGSASSSSSSFTTYYSGGLGLYHQQHQRGGNGGITLLNGVPGSGNSAGPHTYANVVNGNVNLLLGGAMLSLVTTILCVVCYCCHRNIKKRTEAAYRQQRQWLENDPNMEIYSVEQCYETSGLFLGDSSDGLAVLPALHHEPPPSYDAVVLHEQQLLQQQQLQQQQLQQQQLLLQRVSPPPGYHSTLDISTLAVAATCGRGTPDGMAMNECVAESSMSAAASSSNFVGSTPQTVAGRKPLNAQAALNMKRVLNAQSCCSLQRAEVENMWYAAAAAVAARNGNGNCMELETYTPPPALQARKHGSNMATGSRLNSFGRRYLQQTHQHSHNYRRGCPLCGKFRYDAEDALTASTESVLDTATTSRDGQTLPSLEHRFVEDDSRHDVNDNVCNLPNDGQAVVAEEPAKLDPQMVAETFDSTVNDDDIEADGKTADATNGNAIETMAATVEESGAVATDENENAATNGGDANAAINDLDSINDNGIVSLDMSKIIDRSGLPTYEGALKLESSGYV
ncbi:uncharacterized protein LOC115634274 [Scaptodrosophila lebanonensis]|uniref:Uncharacterized protein LOC115634274 n=1 Tax=Drosophila lebanonensis TaxID=7225 RepID=A0A6J2UKL1_DROLE|nr:uncharacterized protein LOC115634274 [Scaptodrosophila lebanonensis]